MTNRLLLDANVQIGPNFWWGAQQKNALDPTTIPVQDDALTIQTPNGPVTFTGLNYRSANWSGHTGFTRVFQGAVSYVTGSHSAKFGARFHKNTRRSRRTSTTTRSSSTTSGAAFPIS